jgi:hypothetical protein
VSGRRDLQTAARHLRRGLRPDKVVSTGRVVVRSEITDKEYDCSQNAAGAWQCGRCGIGLIPTLLDGPPSLGAACLACHARVVVARAPSVPRLICVVVLIVLAALAVAAIRQLL